MRMEKIYLKSEFCVAGGSTAPALRDICGPGGENLPEEGLQDGQEWPQAPQKGPAQAR